VPCLLRVATAGRLGARQHCASRRRGPGGARGMRRVRASRPGGARRPGEGEREQRHEYRCRRALATCWPPLCAEAALPVARPHAFGLTSTSSGLRRQLKSQCRRVPFCSQWWYAVCLVPYTSLIASHCSRPRSAIWAPLRTLNPVTLGNHDDCDEMLAIRPDNSAIPL